MSKSSKARDSGNTGVDPGEIDSLIASLASEDGFERQSARLALVAMGEPALIPLKEALFDTDYQVRWEAAKALGEIREPSTAPALVNALEDADFGVRWLAAEALIGLRRAALSPLLQALAERGQFTMLREGAHHVLRTLCEMGLRDKVVPVLKALQGSDPQSEVPLAARKALEEP
jgi:HEAT repeat protein